MKTTPPKSSPTKRNVIKGVPVVPGLSVGKVYRYRDMLSRKLSTYYLKDGESSQEIRRFYNALKKAKREVARVGEHVDKNLNNGSAQIFTFQHLSLQDEHFVKEVETEIETRKVNAEAVVRDVIQRKINQIESSNSVQIQQRADDLKDMMRFVLKALFETQTVAKTKKSERHIIVAKKLLPSDAVYFGSSAMAGLITQHGGQDSHVALLAREYSVPFVTNVNIEKLAVTDDDFVVVDGDNGKIVVNPTSKEIKECQANIDTKKEELKTILVQTKNSKLEYKGNQIAVFANNFGPADIKLAVRYGAEGIGLYRLEGLFMSMNSEPSSEQIYESLKSSLVSVKGKPVTMRLLDAGADKSIPSMPFSYENVNPLGLRGIRLLFRHERVLRAQLSALIRLAQHHDIRILIPLVTTADDIRKTRRILAEQWEQSNSSGVRLKNMPMLGAMIETPAAVCLAEKIISLSDFVSVGTNDLLQYTMVLDRDDNLLKNYYNEGVKIILPMIRSVIEKSNAQGKHCSVCGEIAAETSYTKKLLDCGLQNFSVTPSAIPFLKEKILSL